MNTKHFSWLVLFMFLPAIMQAQNNENAHNALSKTDRKFFIENRGQWHSDVLYLCRIGGLDAWVTKYGVNYTFYKVERADNWSLSGFYKPTNHTAAYRNDHQDMENTTILGHRVLLELQNHNANPQTEGKQQQEGYYNYFIGNDPSKYATYIGLYKEAVVKNVYDGIDIRYYFDKGYLRYDYVVHAGADPSQIQFKLRGQYNDWITTKPLNNGGFGTAAPIQPLYRNRSLSSEQRERTETTCITYTTRFGEVALAKLHTYQANTTI